MPEIISYARLPFRPDTIAVQNEVASLTGWQSHYNTAVYHGGWSILPLRAPGGNMGTGYADPITGGRFEDTPLMRVCPGIRRLTDSLLCEKMAVRLLNLQKGAYIKPHRDTDLAFEKGEARLHFPVFTNPSVEFCQNGELLRMLPGECWYINANLPHSVKNGGNTDRLHLVVDCVVNDWLRGVFDQAEKKTIPVPDAHTLEIIENLRMQNTETADRLADRLEKEFYASDPS